MRDTFNSVATVPTACGIETANYNEVVFLKVYLLQQCLPLAVLKLFSSQDKCMASLCLVATVPTACGIETFVDSRTAIVSASLVATVPTACGIETPALLQKTASSLLTGCNSAYRLRY